MGRRIVRDDWIRRSGMAAIAAGVIGILLGPLHALAYFATEDGSTSQGLLRWNASGRAALEPLLSWGSADTVYTTYGKAALLVIAGFTAGLLAMRAARSSVARGVERWGLRVATVGYPLLLAGVVVEYWTPYLEAGFLLLSVPGLLLTLVGSTLLGVGLLRARVGPPAARWLFALSLPLVVLMSAIIGHLTAGLLALDLAWIVAGAAFVRDGRIAWQAVPAADGPSPDVASVPAQRVRRRGNRSGTAAGK